VCGAGHRSAQGDYRQLQNDPAVYSAGGGGASVAGSSHEAIARERRFFSFEPGARWHGFEGYASDQYFVDPCKLLLTTPGIDAESGKYTDFGIPATILAHYLRENGIVPEKCDLNSILFLLTPAESARSWRSWWRCSPGLNSILNPTPR
jgi:ornithine decarboxylase